MKGYMFYNKEKGSFHFSKSGQKGHGETNINKVPYEDSFLKEFEDCISIIFDFENRPENEWEYKRFDSKNPSSGFVQRAFNRFVRHKRYISGPIKF